MGQKNLKIYIACLISSFILLPSLQVSACGFYESESDYRAMMFRVYLPWLKCLQPFTYTSYSSYYSPEDRLTSDPDENDRYNNCSEWQAACKNKPLLNDIYRIQYDTDAALFLKVYEEGLLNETFVGNSFIKFLTEKGNENLLHYMFFAKKAELYEIGSSSRFEEWDTNRYYGYSTWDNYNKGEKFTVKESLLNIAKSKLNSETSQFLKQRYAFQVCRLSYQLGQSDNVIETYDKCFSKIDKNNLMSVWAGLFKAMATPSDDSEHYRLLIQVFNNSDEKKFRSVQLFEDSIDVDGFTPRELSTAKVMIALRNPGRALDQIKESYNYDKSNEYISFLILREINKLEDWLITPLFYGKYSITHDDPFQCAYYNKWYEDYKKNHTEEDDDEKESELQKDNLNTDMEYMTELKSLLIDMLSTANGEIKDFYAISLAHLSLLQENTTDASKYMAMVSDKANPSILLQKKLETIWLTTKTQDIESNKFKDIFMQNISDLERISTPNYKNRAMLYTLTLSLANEYLKKGNRVYGNLLRLKSDSYYHMEDDWYYSYRSEDTYTSIEYFDKNATISDMDVLISLLEKSKKTSFEEYLLNQQLGSVNAYKELKGTIAFRNNDLKLAYTTFASMPHNYWQGGNFSFSAYLNEDPFIPKGIKADKYREFDYKFSKADFVKELLDLQEKAAKDKTKSADYYNKLGDAYFNTTYWGNSWMMMRYSWSVMDMNYSKTDCLPEWMRNYMTADMARGYYEKALKEAVNDEQKTYATIMLRYVHYLCFSFRGLSSDKQWAAKYADNLVDYKNTQAYQIYRSNCIAPFIASSQREQ